MVTLILVLALFTAPVMAEEESSGKTAAIGCLSYLNMTEEEMKSRLDAERPAYDYLRKQGVVEFDELGSPVVNVIFYDSLNAMLFGLQSGEISAMTLPDCTAKYLTSANDQLKQPILYYPEKAEEFSQDLLNVLCNGYSFMMLEENIELRDQFNQVIEEMKKDGTMKELIRIHITEAAQSGEPVAVAFEKFEGEPIKVAVTGDLPPMDYVAADGSYAGFNTAVLAEIGKRLEKNIELSQVESVGRALALAQDNVDIVFWTRARTEGAVGDGLSSMSEEEHESFKKEKAANQTEEETAIMLNMFGTMTHDEYMIRDIPEGTIITEPYYTDLNVLVMIIDR